jgi:methylated-DNA-[protein]-cysteine S-methyltransferase
MTDTTIVQSPIGPLSIVAGEQGVRRIEFGAHPSALVQSSESQAEALRAAASQLRQYFDGDRQSFELPLDLNGTAFQRRVWAALLEVPYGHTTTYGTLAALLWSDPTEARLHARAVGAAVGATPVPIIVPCHRVLGADGSLTGYRGGLPIKRALLDLEGAGAPGSPAGRQLTLA